MLVGVLVDVVFSVDVVEREKEGKGSHTVASDRLLINDLRIILKLSFSDSCSFPLTTLPLSHQRCNRSV